MITDKDQAAAIVAANTALTSYPAMELTALTEAGGILDQAQLARVWTPETVFEMGVKVVPIIQNGMWYGLSELAPGSDSESGSIEPAWPVYAHGGVLDSSLLWVNLGPAPSALWDLSYAEHLVYKRKLALVQGNYNVALDARDKFDRQGVVENLQDMVERTAPFVVA